MSIVTRNHGKPWSAADMATLVRLRDEGRTAAQIAERLGRTTATIYAQLGKIGHVLQGTCCQRCGKALVQEGTGRKKLRWCGIACRMAARREATAAALNARHAELRCDVCGAPLPRTRHKHCSKKCDQRAWYLAVEADPKRRATRGAAVRRAKARARQRARTAVREPSS